jgi:hypothetical protein
MANGRPPIFELHIRPMFRLLDRVHMERLAANKRIDLWDYQQVKDKQAKIAALLADVSPMPTRNTGGPWPQEWIDLFVRWTQTEFGRLTPVAGSALQVTKVAADRYELSCGVTLPDATATAWFDIQAASADAQVYELCVEPMPAAAPLPTAATVNERISGPLTTAEVVVIDSAGRHSLPIPP